METEVKNNQNSTEETDDKIKIAEDFKNEANEYFKSA